MIAYTTYDSNYLLSEFRFSHEVGKGLTAIQLAFSNGNQSPIFSVGYTSEAEFETIRIDQSQQIRYIKMRVQSHSNIIEGIALMSLESDYIIDVMWDEESSYNGEITAAQGDWTQPQEIPVGQHIIGLWANTDDSDSIRGLAFLTTELD